MTTPPIPDAPGLPEWVLAYSHLDGSDQYVRVVDITIVQSACTCNKRPSGHRFRVGAGRAEVSRHTTTCPVSTQGPMLPMVLGTNNESEALAVFAAHHDRLAEESE